MPASCRWQVRLAAAAAVVGNTMWLMAGWDPGHKRDGGQILADLWALDLTTWAWREVKPQVRSPCGCRVMGWRKGLWED